MQRLALGGYGDKKKSPLSEVDQELKNLLQYLIKCEEKNMSDSMTQLNNELSSLEEEDIMENENVETSKSLPAPESQGSENHPVVSQDSSDDYEEDIFGEDEESVEEGPLKENLQIFDMKMDVVFSLPLTNPNLLGRKAQLSKTSLKREGLSLDFYSPLRRGTRDKNETGSFRSILPEVLDEVAALNGTYNFVGTISAVENFKEQLFESIEKKIDKLFLSIGSPSHEFIVGDDEFMEEKSSNNIRLSDLLYYALSVVQENNSFKFVLNLNIHSPSFYDSEDKVKESQRLEKFLSSVSQKTEGVEDFYLAFPISSEMLLSSEIRKEFVDYLLDSSNEYLTYSRFNPQELEYPISPQEPESLITDTLLFIKKIKGQENQ